MGPAGFIGSFENKGDIIEAGIGSNFPEQIYSDGTFAQWGMTVKVSAEGSFGVIEMHTPQEIPTDQAFKLVETFFKSSIGGQIITGGESVTGIQTHPGAVGHIDEFEQTCKLFKGITEICSLTGSIFKNCYNIGNKSRLFL